MLITKLKDESKKMKGKQGLVIILLVILLVAMIAISIFALSGIRRGVSTTKLTSGQTKI